MNATVHLATSVGVQPACAALGVDRASFYRHRPILGPMEWESQTLSDARRCDPTDAVPSCLELR